MKDIEKQAALAATYAGDGALHTAAKIMREVADELEAAAKRKDSLMERLVAGEFASPILISEVSRTDEEIVAQTNMLARICLRYIGTGYEVPQDHRFWSTNDPRSKKAWKMACEIMESLTATSADDALSNIEE